MTFPRSQSQNLSLRFPTLELVLLLLQLLSLSHLSATCTGGWGQTEGKPEWRRLPWPSAVDSEQRWGMPLSRSLFHGTHSAHTLNF